jgi:hypothetical protein
MKVHILLITLLYSLSQVLLGHAESKMVQSKEIVLSHDFGKKLGDLKREHEGFEEKDFFKAHAVTFDDGTNAVVELADGKYTLHATNTVFNLNLIEAVCEWHNRYSTWFTADMLHPSRERLDRSVNEARWVAANEARMASIMEILEEIKSRSK